MITTAAGASAGPDLQHFLLTRFNVVWNKPSMDKYFSDDWMRGRIELFERYTYPSVAAQTDRNFTWLIFFDEARSRRHRDFVASLAARGIRPVFVDELASIPAAVQRIAAQRGSGGRVATSRVDADDVLDPRYMHDVKQAIAASVLPRFIVDFPCLEALRPADGRRRLMLYERSASAFMTLVEPMGPTLLTALGFDHTKLPPDLPLRPLWRIRTRMLIHEVNAENRMTTLRRELRRIARRAPAKLPIFLALSVTNPNKFS